MKGKILRILAIVFAIFTIVAVGASRWFDIEMPWHTNGSLASLFIFIPLFFILISDTEKKEDNAY